VFKYAGVVVNNESLQVDRIFTYRIPDFLMGEISIGHWVKVPFGRGNKLIDGFILSLMEHTEEQGSLLKDIASICQSMPVITLNDLQLIEFMRDKYLCSYLDCIKSMIPTGLLSGVKAKTSEVLCLRSELKNPHNKPPYIDIYNVIKEYDGKLTKASLAKDFGFSLSSVNTMLKHGYITKDEIIINRYNSRLYNRYEERVLNNDQSEAVTSILNSGKRNFLLHGVTGSGKTEVYMNLVGHMLKIEKQCIILVPEISLTPQMVERFKGRFGTEISVFHSRLADGERYDEWLRVKSGKAKVAIGARSAVFLPFSNLGLIVIDEEHESSYKSESNPKYDTREVAELRCKQSNGILVLGSATPSVETYNRALNKEITLITLLKRADNAKMPDIELVDMREELVNNNKSIFSRKLYNNIKDVLNSGEQIILFLNRRGFSTFVSCRKCGYVFKCGNCDISMTYHHSGNYLGCHYCGTTQRISNSCPKCGSNYVKYFGTGTEKVEAEIKRFFPSVNTLRMDLDTTKKKNSYEDIYTAFKNHEAQILIGTQMIAKGLDFPNVTLVGVLAADLSLNLPDYKAAERTFQLITQVSGRAGRSKKSGKVIIQTYNPEHYSIGCSVTGSYNNFFNQEISLRESMNYPPFSRIVCINLSSKNEGLLINRAQKLGVTLKQAIADIKSIDILGPCPCAISKIKELYRWQIILKGNFEQSLVHNIKRSIYEDFKDVYNDIKISIDINPVSLL
jgi:primosomal protein N' (replication factor Y) (superfamily II helicase)